MVPPPLTSEQVARFHRDGYLFVPGLLDSVETELVLPAARSDAQMRVHAMHIADTKGRRRTCPCGIIRVTTSTAWSPGRTASSTRWRSCLGGEVYHYHSKLTPRNRRWGAWEWHQDYGYWYQFGCLFPEMASVYIAMDPATRENGCLQVIRGSHHFGRIDHGRFGDRPEPIPSGFQALARLEHIYCEMEPARAFLPSNFARLGRQPSDDPLGSALLLQH